MVIVARGVPWGALARAQATYLFDNIATALPGTLTLTRSGTTARYYTSSLLATAVAANTARFGYDPERVTLEGFRWEPASTNKQRNSGGIAASDSASFNTSTGSNAGTWGTLPSFTNLVIPAADAYGSTTGWQIVSITTLADGTQVIRYRLKCTNNAPVDPTNPTANTRNINLVLSSNSSASMQPVNPGETWTESYQISLVSGAPTPAGGMRTAFAAYYGASTVPVVFLAKGQSTPATTPDFTYQYATFTFPVGTPVDRMTSRLSFVVYPGETLDITFDLTKRQREQMPSPTSFISAVAADATRSADVLTRTVPFAGKWYARCNSHYRNFDTSFTTGTTTLTMTVPQEAIDAGVYQFNSISLSSQPFPPDQRCLRFEPPSRTGIQYTASASPFGGAMPTSREISPVTGLPYGSDPANRVYEDTVDVIVQMPLGGVLGNLKIIGGRSVTIMGGAFLPSDAAGFLNPDLRFMLTLAGQKEWVFLEGVLFDGVGSAVALDAIRLSGIVEAPLPVQNLYAPVCYRQNLRIQGVKGHKLPGTDHGDCTQVTAPIGATYADRVMGSSGYQGDFEPNVARAWEQDLLDQAGVVLNRPVPPMYIEQKKLSRAVFAWESIAGSTDSGAQVWLANSPGLTTNPLGAGGDEFPIPTDLYNVWTSQNPSLVWEDSSVWPPVDTPHLTTDEQRDYWNARLADNGLSLTWNPVQLRNGCVRKVDGTTPDYCPVGIAGDFYKSPGYGYIP